MPLSEIKCPEGATRWWPYLLLSLLVHGSLMYGWRTSIEANPIVMSPFKVELAAELKRETVPVSAPSVLKPSKQRATRAPQLHPQRTQTIQQTASAVAILPPETELNTKATSINLDAAKSMARSLAIEREQKTLVSPKDAHLNLDLPKEEKETALAKNLRKAVRADCKQAYQGLGLLAVPILLKDTMLDSGCNW